MGMAAYPGPVAAITIDGARCGDHDRRAGINASATTPGVRPSDAWARKRPLNVRAHCEATVAGPPRPIASRRR